MPKPWPISRIFMTALAALIGVIGGVLAGFAVYVMWQSEQLQARTEEALFESLSSELRASYGALEPLLVSRQATFRAAHEAALRAIGSTDPGTIDIDRLKRVVQDRTGIPVDVCIIGPDRIVQRTTYPPDQGLNFNEPALLDARNMIDRARDQSAIVVGAPVLEVMARDFRVYTYSPLGESGHILQFGFVPATINHHFKELEKALAQRSLFRANLYVMMRDNTLLSLQPERLIGQDKQSVIEASQRQKAGLIDGFHRARELQQPVPVNGTGSRRYTLQLMDLPYGDMNVMAVIEMHDNAVATTRLGLMTATGITFALLLTSVLITFMWIRRALADPLSRAARAMKEWQPMTLTGISRSVRELQLLASHYNHLLEGTRTKIRGLDEQVRTDTLTGLANRRWLESELETEIRRCERHHEPLSVIFIDVDHFKSINDNCGHLAGDEVLRRFARTLQQRARGADTVGRWGGEEFMMICRNTRLDDALTLAEALRHTIEAMDLCDGQPCTASFGVTALEPGDTAETLLNRSDNALYRAKKAGRNRVERD